MCTQRGEEEIHASLPPLLLVCFAFRVFWEEVALKEEARRKPSSHLTDEETDIPRGTSTGPKSHGECGGSYCISRAKLGLYVTRIPFPAWLWVGHGHQKNLHEIWKVEVEQQPRLRSDPCEIRQRHSSCICCPPAGSPVGLGQEPDTWQLQAPLDFLLQLLQTLD